MAPLVLLILLLACKLAAGAGYRPPKSGIALTPPQDQVKPDGTWPGHQKHAAMQKKKENHINFGTCYAHACATALLSVEASIYGRVKSWSKEALKETYWQLVDKIVAKYGIKGAHIEDVLRHFSPRHNARYESLGPPGTLSVQNVAAALHGDPFPRVVVLAFSLPQPGAMWNYVFNSKERSNLEPLTSKLLDQARRHCAKSGYDCGPKAGLVGHAVAIVAQTPQARNSWGDRWGAKGYFLLSKSDTRLFQEMRVQAFDVFFRIEDLPSADRAAFKSATRQQRRKYEQQTMVVHRDLVAESGIPMQVLPLLGPPGIPNLILPPAWRFFGDSTFVTGVDKERPASDKANNKRGYEF